MHEKWANTLFNAMDKTPAHPDAVAPNLDMIFAAGNGIWGILAKKTRKGIKPDGMIKPLEYALAIALADESVLAFLRPRARGYSSKHSPSYISPTEADRLRKRNSELQSKA